jgi:hypothetical protein
MIASSPVSGFSFFFLLNKFIILFLSSEETRKKPVPIFFLYIFLHVSKRIITMEIHEVNINNFLYYDRKEYRTPSNIFLHNFYFTG